MKPFNLEAALAGAPVVTRDGDVVTGLHLFEAATTDRYPLMGVVAGKVRGFATDGRYMREAGHPFDLFMAPVKKQGWVNLYPPSSKYTDCMADCQFVWSTKEAALAGARSNVKATVMIEWEE